MRIIAGEFRGRKLLAPDTDATRPITDRAKQSLFDILNPLLDGSIIYDCFSGTGSMGLECLSRGASFAAFFDAERAAIKRLQSNIEMLKVKDRSRIVAGDIFKHLESNKPLAPSAADLIFLDPPYAFLREKPGMLKQLARSLIHSHMKPEATVIFRHDAADALELDGLARYDLREYGQMQIELLRRTA